ncbi:MAG: isoprenylcysteine carboxylmethyltransferase family protein [Candidatus Binatia bacterium]
MSGGVRGAGWLVLLSRWRVNLATILVVPALLAARPDGPAILAWLPLVLAGVALRTWARGHMERDVYLARTGPYRHMRHPLYVGSFLIGVGLAGMTRSPWVVGGLLGLFLVMYVPKAIREEAFLTQKFGEAYVRYAAAVGPIFPHVHGPPIDADAHRFQWKRVFRRREWQTWLGVLAALVVLVVRAGYRPR